MDHARYNPLDAQRFDPLLRTRAVSISFGSFLGIIAHLCSILGTQLAFQHQCFKTDNGAGPLRPDRASEGA
jgi:hypothetical protein